MFGINYKMWITENAEKKFQEYLNILNAEKSLWGEIAIGFGSVDDVRFDNFYAEGKCNHPKRMYRPGNTVICHFLPIADEVYEKYKKGVTSEENWEAICLDTRRISRGITDSITATLQSYGREVSLLPERENWSHACGAEVAGLPTFEKVGDMFIGDGKIGCIGSVITEVKISD